VLCIVNNPACKDDNTKEIVGARAKDVHRGNPQGHKIENAPLNFLYTLGKVAFFFAKALIIILKNWKVLKLWKNLVPEGWYS